MDRERLTRLLEEPARVAREDLGDLKALAERYPWFSGAQLLRVAGEQAAGSVLFDETLKGATAHLPSRAVLFDLVETKGQGAPIPPRPEARILRLPVAEQAPIVVHTVSAPLPPIEPEEAPLPVIDAMPTAPMEPLELEPTMDSEGDPLERQIMEAALASAYDLTWKEETAVPVAPKPTAADKKEATPPDSPVAATPVPGSRLRFTAWLETAPPVEGATPPAATSAATPPDAHDWLRGAPANPVPPHHAPPGNTIDTRELIDRFIQQQTPEPVHKAEFFTPQQAAKRSLDDKAGLVTETLARVYEKQGNLPKAIEAYRKLALKYPHKSDYFAALQKSLEEQLNK